ncbi:hypothetical protein [Kitasatospora sp. NPDC059673]|uniref:hypothetical protein n=1 Tax=Kitasatospora sp. NPDC059673 TaxID=3346901 RepID=UPI003675BC54
MHRAVPPTRLPRTAPVAAMVVALLAAMVVALAVALVVALLPGPAGDRFTDTRGAAARAAGATVGSTSSAVSAASAVTVVEEEPEGVERGRDSTTSAPQPTVHRDARTPGTVKRTGSRAAVHADGCVAPRTPPDTAGRPAPAARPAGPAALQVFRR